MRSHHHSRAASALACPTPNDSTVSQALGRLVLLCALALATASLASAQTLQPTDLTYQGSYTIDLHGLDSTYGQGLTSRRVNGALRFLHLSYFGRLDEFALPSAFGGRVTSPLRSWNLNGTGALDDVNGLWFEEAKNRLWVTSATDYTATYEAARIVTMTLNDNGTVSNVHTVLLSGVPERRMYGGCQPSPLSGYAYVCGWGGYTSLMMSAGAASLGPTMYAISDPALTPEGGVITAKVILDAANPQTHRGLRATIPQNYFDGGDPRSNPPTRPTAAPDPAAAWLSPNPQGKGWMVWGDSYYNTGMLIPGRGFLMVASLCKGSCWYQSSTLAFDGRQFEWHIWDPAVLTGADILERPTSMQEFTLPNRGMATFQGNTSVENIGGATFAMGSVYLLSCGGNGTIYQFGCGVFQFAVAGEGMDPPIGDTTAPLVSLTNPSGDIAVSRLVRLAATASDNVGVLGVWFTVDGVPVGAEDASVPYETTWDAAGATAGLHVVAALVRDAAGNTGVSAPVTVSVFGTTPTCLCSSGASLTDAGSSCLSAPAALVSEPDGGTFRWHEVGDASRRSGRLAWTFQTLNSRDRFSLFGSPWRKRRAHPGVTLSLVVTSCP